MGPPEAPISGKKKLLKVLLFGLVCLVVLMSIAGFLLYNEIAPVIYQAQWSRRLTEGTELWKTDADAGKKLADKMFADARSQNLPTAAMMGLYKQYAEFLYQQDEKELGDEQISAGIALCKTAPTSNTLEADQLTHLYQDRGWDSHRRFLKDQKLPSGKEDQEQSVAVAEKAFGPDHEQTIYKIPTLAIIYADIGEKDKAEKTIQRAISAADTKPGAKECAWFAYAMLSRIRAVQGDYKAATEAYLHANSICADETQRGRCWEEYTTGLRQGQPDRDELERLAISLLNKENYDELDKIGDNFVSSKESLGDGFWKLDYFSTALDGKYNTKEKRYQQRALDLSRWLAKKPHSPIARVALAQCHIYNAWAVKLAESAPNKGADKLFHERITKAKELLNADPDISKKNPIADLAYLRIAVAERNREKFDQIIANSHKQWPDYYCLDTWVYKFLWPQWLGKKGDPDKFIVSRSDEIGGAKGDMEYARLVWQKQENIPDLFEDGSLLKWSRVKSGFKQIFAQYPQDIEPRISFIELTFRAHDQEAIKEAFDHYVPTAKAIKVSK